MSLKILKYKKTAYFFLILIPLLVFIFFYRNKITSSPVLQNSMRSTSTPSASFCLNNTKAFSLDEALINPSQVCALRIAPVSSRSAMIKLARVSSSFINVESLFLNKTVNPLPPEIKNFINLKAINFHHTVRTHLPPEIGQLKKLIAINLSKADIENLPPELGDLHNLTQLIIVHNTKPVSIPPEIEKLSKLNTLTLRSNPAILLPPTLVNNQNIEYLDLSDNKLIEIPSIVFKLRRLKTLNLSNNKLTDLPVGIENLNKLKYLNLSGNNLKNGDISKLKQILPLTQIVY